MAYMNNTTSWAIPPRRSLLKGVIAFLKARPKQRLDRLDYEYLLRADDHMLKDIGLTCDDVKAALHKPTIWL